MSSSRWLMCLCLTCELDSVEAVAYRESKSMPGPNIALLVDWPP